jgi:hypothetical protein
MKIDLTLSSGSQGRNRSKTPLIVRFADNNHGKKKKKAKRVKGKGVERMKIYTSDIGLK